MTETPSVSREVSQSDVAMILGLSTRQVSNLERAGMPYRAEKNRKWYPLPDAVHWWRDREVSRAVSALEVSEIEALKARKLEAEAAQKEIELEELRGSLVAVEAVRATWSDVLSRLRAKIIAAKGSLAPRMVGHDTPREAKAVLDAAFDELLDELRETADEIEDEEVMEPGAA